MDTISFPIFPRNTIKKQTLFSINDIQVIFNTDVKTAEKLEDDEVLKDYIRAVIQANLLSAHGIVDTTQITSIERLDVCDAERVIVALDIATNVQQGVEELRCCVTEERILSDIDEPAIHSEDSSLSWPQPQISEVTTGPTLRWNSEMTSLLIRIRGDMDRDFNRAKYKFRLWEKVATKMNALLLNVKVTAKDCDDKWRNIVATYRKNIDKIKCYGDNSVRWEYFNAMDNILKGTKDLSDPLNENTSEQMAKLINELNNSELVKGNNDVEVIDISTEHTSEEEMICADDDESSNDCIITRKSDDEKRKWTLDMCLMLLYLRSQADTRFKENFENTYHLWKDLACQMSERLMTDFSANEVESVWNHCVITYEINLENLKSKGVNTIKWKYFAVMDELLGGTNEIADICVPRPGEQILKKFRQLQLRNEFLRASAIPETDPLCFTTPPVSIDDESDNEDNFTLSGNIWTKDMVKTLIFLKKQINEEIATNKLSRKRQWLAIVRRFRTLKNIKVSEEVCEEKWRNLLRTYKKNLLRVKNRGANVKWPFFWKMREIVGNSVLLDSEKKTLIGLDSANRSRFNEPSKRTSFSVEYMDEVDDILEDRIQDQMDNLFTAVTDLRQNQLKSMQDMLETQNKAIVEIQQEQINIKCLLTQLLQKFT